MAHQDKQHRKPGPIGRPTPDKAEGSRRKTDQTPDSEQGNVIAPKTPGQAEGTRENVDASLKKQEQEQRKTRKRK